MADWLERTRLLIGEDALQVLKTSRVAVLGLGGVGSAAAEALCRAGVGEMMIVDHDLVDLTNLNRQLLATTHCVGKVKCEVEAERLKSINPDLRLQPVREMYLPDNNRFLFEFQPDYVVDAIDTVTAKLDLAGRCREERVSLITCLGTGNRLDPGALRIGDISETAGTGCPLARVMRKELRRRGLEGQTVLYSTEEARTVRDPSLFSNGRHSPASMAFVPPVAGYLMASYVVRKLLNLE